MSSKRTVSRVKSEESTNNIVVLEKEIELLGDKKPKHQKLYIILVVQP